MSGTGNKGGRWKKSGGDGSSSSSMAPGPAAAAAAAAAPSPATKRKVIVFYSGEEGKPYCEFSNFYWSRFDFVLPEYARLPDMPTKVHCEFSEKAIMLTKAGMMGDSRSFQQIMSASDPSSAKWLGRGVQNFQEEFWKEHLKETAFEVVKQKFEGEASLREVLFSTGDAILAEAAPNDSIWGIGLSTSDDAAYDPERWCGQNVLGFALMQVRDHLRAQAPATEEEKPEEKPKITAFYGHGAGNKYREFSNFYWSPFDFTMPEFARCLEGMPTQIHCEYSEKAIMLMKAALMGDAESFRKIMQSKEPFETKQLGRGVQNFRDDIWNKHLEQVAYEVVRQKFESTSELRETLLSTGEDIIVEAAPTDCIWGVGLGVQDKDTYDPKKWRGENVLGYALMQARDHLRGKSPAFRSSMAQQQPPLPPSSQTAHSEKPEILAFYGHGAGTKFCEFSNFYWSPFDFELPSFARKSLKDLPTKIRCEYSEKAIMLIKAALMGDDWSFREIMSSKDPYQTKKLGRGVWNFREDVWRKYLEQTAYEVVRQKFQSTRALREILLSTGNAIIVEAAPTDRIWGVGLSLEDKETYDPKKWRGENVLGFALMQARDHLLGKPVKFRSPVPEC
eukprot:CAMPEP_0206451818 /NCGR_PEP_ID=MMETSP0324_2-20121206/19575_1 /ASSEMBLY_ACC=CAM_ASM_000836 /TAXON_ID=2866 /ORGANISM="Crypthecodinium cohnii, Strain Seligo" /LENGTH=617 /DNA_ID=CAMNT_0053921787 /DNA_START=297 /DNA_END=2150 /DNA_ORIENTATION=-